MAANTIVYASNPNPVQPKPSGTGLGSKQGEAEVDLTPYSQSVAHPLFECHLSICTELDRTDTKEQFFLCRDKETRHSCDSSFISARKSASSCEVRKLTSTTSRPPSTSIHLGPWMHPWAVIRVQIMEKAYLGLGNSELDKIDASVLEEECHACLEWVG